MKKLLLPTLFCLIVATLAGCATTVSTRNTQPADRTSVFKITSEDVDKATQTWVDDLVTRPPVATSTEPPIIGFCGVANLSRDHFEMGLFDRSFEYIGLRTGKVQFTNAMKLPDGFFEQHKFQKSLIADKDTAVKIGKILGWKYAIYGELYGTKENDAKGNPVIFYDLYVYMLNIETGLQPWNSRYRFQLYADRALIGR